MILYEISLVTFFYVLYCSIAYKNLRAEFLKSFLFGPVDLHHSWQ